jgi:phosphotriesterase-related protein
MLNRRDFLTTLSGAGLVAAVGDVASVTNVVAQSSTRSSQRARVVNTVRGPIDGSKLGVTLPHEHVFAASTGFLQTWPEYFGGRAAFADKCVEKLRAVKDAGVDTIVDVTPADVGRDIRFLEEVSRRSGMQIVACTGHWLLPSLSMSARSVEELTAFFQLEIERGIEATDIKPGVIKVATDREGVTPFLEKVLRAAARASKATGIPVTTHTHAVSRGGEKQAEIFEAEGLNPASVCLGHSDESDDLSYLTGLAKRGYTIGMDHMPMGLRPPASGLVPWQKRAETVKQLIDAGYAEKIFLSNDWYFGVTIAATGAMNAMEQLNPDGMLFTTRKAIPYLKELGVSDQAIRTMTVENPRRFLAGS